MVTIHDSVLKDCNIHNSHSFFLYTNLLFLWNLLNQVPEVRSVWNIEYRVGQNMKKGHVEGQNYNQVLEYYYCFLHDHCILKIIISTKQGILTFKVLHMCTSLIDILIDISVSTTIQDQKKRKWYQSTVQYMKKPRSHRLPSWQHVLWMVHIWTWNILASTERNNAYYVSYTMSCIWLRNTWTW